MQESYIVVSKDTGISVLTIKFNTKEEAEKFIFVRDMEDKFKVIKEGEEDLSMSKVCVTLLKPEIESTEKEFVIEMPKFLEQIDKCKSYQQTLHKDLTALNHLKQIVTTIVETYELDPSITYKIPYSQYVGIRFANEGELSDIILKIIKNHCPEMIDKCISYQIRKRPSGVKIIYFVSDNATKYMYLFINDGIPEISMGDVYAELEMKDKKIPDSITAKTNQFVSVKETFKEVDIKKMADEAKKEFKDSSEDSSQADDEDTFNKINN